VRELELQPQVPSAVLLCVMLGLLIPCLLGYGIIRSPLRRGQFALAVFLLGIGATALSAGLSYGPEHLWAWLNAPARAGLLAALLLVLALLWVPERASAALLLLSLGIYLSLLNQAPTSPYFAQTLSAWEQGRFIRFHGIAQWLGWLWPYAALLYVLSRVWHPDRKN